WPSWPRWWSSAVVSTPHRQPVRAVGPQAPGDRGTEDEPGAPLLPVPRAAKAGLARAATNRAVLETAEPASSPGAGKAATGGVGKAAAREWRAVAKAAARSLRAGAEWPRGVRAERPERLFPRVRAPWARARRGAGVSAAVRAQAQRVAGASEAVRAQVQRV